VSSVFSTESQNTNNWKHHQDRIGVCNSSHGLPHGLTPKQQNSPFELTSQKISSEKLECNADINLNPPDKTTKKTRLFKLNSYSIKTTKRDFNLFCRPFMMLHDFITQTANSCCLLETVLNSFSLTWLFKCYNRSPDKSTTDSNTTQNGRSAAVWKGGLAERNLGISTPFVTSIV